MIELDPQSAMPPFEQVRSQLAGQISDGTLVAGTRLPTVRRLAEELGIAVNTVARAYRELEAAGLVQTQGRAGTVVSAAGDESRARLQEHAERYAALTRELGIEAEQAIRIVASALDRLG